MVHTRVWCFEKRELLTDKRVIWFTVTIQDLQNKTIREIVIGDDALKTIEIVLCRNQINYATNSGNWLER